jgi:hypothetical protein
MKRWIQKPTSAENYEANAFGVQAVLKHATLIERDQERSASFLLEAASQVYGHRLESTLP